MATRKDPLRNYKFVIDVPGFGRAGFSSIDGLNMETEVIEYREGGDPATMKKIPGQTSYDNIVLERGKSDDEDFLSWYNQIFERTGASINLGPFADGVPADSFQPPNDAFRRNIDLFIMDKNGTQKKHFKIFDAWPCRFEHEALDARDAGDVWIERIELCHEGLAIVPQV